jgi:hypothetical protein
MEISIRNKTVLCTAKRNSGKSVLIRWIVQAELHHFRKVYLICPTESVNSFYSSFIDKDCIFDEWNEKWIEQLIDKMTTENTGKKGNNLTNVLLILDDCVGSLNFHQSPTLKRLFARGRHIGVAIIVASQHITAVPPLIRSNSDIVLCGQLNRASLQLLADEYMVSTIDRDEFNKMYANATTNYGFLVIRNQSVENSSDFNLTYGVVRTPPELIE